ncbi:response regulator transcription factor [Rubrivivax albus]|uniref:Response regulator transcription factor n=1 Tax=Rubrivivax albus TaxID=2499835 RepID=A0A3S2UAB8_9BURK|nr:response regulator transcription factor [Rubrivivax albus]
MAPGAPHDLPSALVVDDHDIVRLGVRSLLGERFDVREAHDARSALARLAEAPCDLLLLDLSLGDDFGLTAPAAPAGRVPGHARHRAQLAGRGPVCGACAEVRCLWLRVEVRAHGVAARRGRHRAGRARLREPGDARVAAAAGRRPGAGAAGPVAA